MLKKRVLSLLLALTMILSGSIAVVFAADEEAALASDTQPAVEAVEDSAAVVAPAGVEIKSLFSNKYARFTVKWKSVKGVDGYQVKYSKNKNFKGSKIKTVKNGKARHITVSKVQRVKRYYVKIRTYKIVDGVKYYSGWSKVRSVKIK